jgi:cytochrome c-type biogenesis protein CcmH/NrfF
MFLGLAISNWLIWVVMVLFILGYFTVVEIVNRREARRTTTEKGAR